ncbi:hypothetical protein ACFLY9_00090 [Patescibacteria group bacterium]
MPESDTQTIDIQATCEQACEGVSKLGVFHLQAIQSFIRTSGVLDAPIYNEGWGSTIEIGGQQAEKIREAILVVREVFEGIQLFKLVRRKGQKGVFDVKLRRSEEARAVFQKICEVVDDGGRQVQATVERKRESPGKQAGGKTDEGNIDFISPETGEVVSVSRGAYITYSADRGDCSKAEAEERLRHELIKNTLNRLPLSFLSMWEMELSKRTKGVYTYMNDVFDRHGRVVDRKKVKVTRASIEFDDIGKPVLIKPLLTVLKQNIPSWGLGIAQLSAKGLPFFRHKVSWDIDQSEAILNVIRPIVEWKRIEVEKTRAAEHVEVPIRQEEPTALEPALPEIPLPVQRLVLRVLITGAEEKIAVLAERERLGDDMPLRTPVLVTNRSLGELVQELSPDGVDATMRKMLTENQTAVVASVLEVEVDSLDTVGLRDAGVAIYIEHAGLFTAAVREKFVELGGEIPIPIEVYERIPIEIQLKILDAVEDAIRYVSHTPGVIFRDPDGMFSFVTSQLTDNEEREQRVLLEDIRFNQEIVLPKVLGLSSANDLWEVGLEDDGGTIVLHDTGKLERRIAAVREALIARQEEIVEQEVPFKYGNEVRRIVLEELQSALKKLCDGEVIIITGESSLVQGIRSRCEEVQIPGEVRGKLLNELDSFSQFTIAAALGTVATGLYTVGLRLQTATYHGKTGLLVQDIDILQRTISGILARLEPASPAEAASTEQREIPRDKIRFNLVILRELQNRLFDLPEETRICVSGSNSTFARIVQTTCDTSNPQIPINEELREELEDTPQFVIRKALGVKSLESIGLVHQVDDLGYLDKVGHIFLKNSQRFNSAISSRITEFEAALSEELGLGENEITFVRDFMTRQLEVEIASYRSIQGGWRAPSLFVAADMLRSCRSREIHHRVADDSPIYGLLRTTGDTDQDISNLTIVIQQTLGVESLDDTGLEVDICRDGARIIITELGTFFRALDPFGYVQEGLYDQVVDSVEYVIARECIPHLGSGSNPMNIRLNIYDLADNLSDRLESVNSFAKEQLLDGEDSRLLIRVVLYDAVQKLDDGVMLTSPSGSDFIRIDGIAAVFEQLHTQVSDSLWAELNAMFSNGVPDEEIVEQD